MTDSEKHHDEQANGTAGSEKHADSGHGDADTGSGSTRERSESWSHAHEAFERLSVEEKAFFLVESAFDTMLSGLREAGDVVRDAMEDALSDLEKRKQEARRHARTGNDASGEHHDTGTE